MFKKLSTSLLLCLITFGAFFGTIQSEEKSVSLEFANTTFAVESSPIPSWDIDALNKYVAEQQKNSAWWSKSSSTSSQEMQKMYQAIAEGLNIFLGFITLIVSPAVMFAWWLMSPDWTSGDLFGLREVFYKLWITISNITYFIYAILLVFIALATMFGSDHYGYKALLPKLALGILMVPFTWWAVQFVISLSTIVTASVMSIPHDTLSRVEEENSVQWGFWTKQTIPKQIIIESNQEFDKVLKDSGNNTVDQGGCASGSCISPKEFLQSAGGMYGYMMVYAYGVFKIDEVKKINTNVDAVKSLVSIINQWLVGSIMFLVFGVLTLALIFMLMTRAMMLWVYTIFSPFLTLDFVLGGSLLKGVGDSFSIKEFIGLAFVPAVVWLSLSFWLVIISAVTSGGTKSISASQQCTTSKLTTPEWCTLVGIMGNPNNKITRRITNFDEFTNYAMDNNSSSSAPDWKTENIISIGGINIIFKWTIKSNEDLAYADTANNITSAIGSAGGIFGTIIVDLIAIMFIWIAFMAAKWINKVVSAAAKPFEELGNKVWSMAASAPKYMPLPIPGGSIAWASKWIGQLESIKEQMANKRFDDSGFGKFVKNMNPEMQLNEDQKTKYNKLLGGSKNDIVYQKDLKDFISSLTWQQALYNKDALNELKKWIAGMNDANIGVGSWYSDKQKSAIDKVKKISNEDDRALFIAAIMRWYDVSNIGDDPTKSLNSAKSFLAGSGGGTRNASGQSGNDNSWMKIKSTWENNFNLQIGANTILNIDKKAPKIDMGKLDDPAKEVLKWMTKSKFIEMLAMDWWVDKDMASKLADGMGDVFGK